MLLVTVSGYCSQIANHVRIAYEAMEDPGTPDIIRNVLQRNIEAYKAGAAGPDVLTNVAGKISGLAHKAHYERTGELVKNMLQIAARQKDPATREKYFAYALGWLTHNYLDVYEHAVVNEYGGLYSISKERHTDLEMFESAHVFATSCDPSKSFVPDRSGFPNELIVEAFHKTYSDWWSPAFVPVLLDNAAYAVEDFTKNMAKEFQTQKHQSGIHEVAVGQIPFAPTYYNILSPVFAGISSIRPPGSEKGVKEIQAQIDYLLMDNSMKLSYITDWYDSNPKALTAIQGRFRAIAGSISLREGVLEINPAIEPVVPDYNLDTGRLESAGNSYAESVSRKFKPIEEMELNWEVYDGQRKIADGSEPIFITQPGTVGTFTLSIPPSKQFYSDKGKKELKLRVVLYSKNSNPHLTQGEYATAFRFKVEEQSNCVHLDNRQRLPIQDSDEKSFWISSPAAAQRETTSAEAVVSIDDLLQKMRDAVGRAASIAGNAQQKASALQNHLAAGGQQLVSVEQGTQELQNNVSTLSDSASKIGQLPEQVAESAGKIQAACNRVATARDQALKKALEACESAEAMKNSTDPAERSRLLPRIQSAANEAEANAKIASSEWADASQALGGLKQAADVISTFVSRIQQDQAEWNRLSSALKPLQELIADGQHTIAEIQSLAKDLEIIKNEGAGYLQEGVTRLAAHPDAQKAAELRKALEALYGQVLSHTATVAGLSADPANQLGAFENRVQSASASLQAISGALTGMTVPQMDVSRIAEASAWVDAAELFVEPSNTAAANARKCANAAASLPPLTPTTGNPNPTEGQPATGPDWEREAAQGNTTTTPSGGGDWDSAAESGTTTTSSRTEPQVAQNVPAEQSQQQPATQKSKPNREWANDLLKTLTDLQKTISQPKNTPSPPQPTGNNPVSNPQNTGNPCAQYCAISGGRYGSQVHLLFERTIRDGCNVTRIYDVFSVDDDPDTPANEINQFIATWKQSSPGASTSLLARYNTFSAALNAAKSKCPKPQFTNIQ